MGENISTVAKVALVSVLVGIVISVTVVILSVSLDMGKSITEPVYNTNAVLSQNLYKVSLEKSISAPVAYKILKQNEKSVQTVSITLSGATYEGMNQASVLLKNASKNVSVTISENSTYGYDVVIKEVAR